ncbi:PREDICTED: ribokinase-like [Acropora digitifera]|uniref:ribokinase-like n=1 Tax=Acropora digitifera TaxID=70779 RepID=UPI00077AFF71|nr:PREDICTED: ribokinase-like [Acropora digitifera]
MAGGGGKFDVVVVGSCMTDLVSYVPRLPKAGETIHGTKFSMGFGGKGANQCIMAARLGAKTAMVAKVSLFCHFALVDHVSVAREASTGVAPIAVNASGENSIVIVSGANDLLSEDDVKNAKSMIASASVCVCQLEINPEVTHFTLSLAKKAGVQTILNAAPASAWLDYYYYRLSDVFCANESEAELLTGLSVNTVDDAEKAVIMILERGAGQAVITLGSKGSVIGTQENPIPKHIPVTPADPVDSTGAGDAFIGAMAFYMAKFKMLPFEEIVRRAGEIARTSVLNPGTQSSYLSKKELSPSLFSELVQRGRGIST